MTLWDFCDRHTFLAFVLWAMGCAALVMASPIFSVKRGGGK